LKEKSRRPHDRIDVDALREIVRRRAGETRS
jgi:hypothetical protein